MIESGDAQSQGRWRQRGYTGALYEGTEIILRVDCIHALYRREWQRPECVWEELSRLMGRMRDPPLAIDSETHQTDAAWAKAVERLKRYGDQQVLQSRERLEPAWHDQVQRGLGESSGCTVA